MAQYDAKMRTLILIPAYNEADSLPELLEEIRSLEAGHEILVVDDASTDGSGELLPGLGVRYLQLSQHLGVGGSIRAGLRWSRIQGFETVLRMDGDGQHDPGDIRRLLEALKNHDTEAVVGSRYRGTGGYRSPGGLRLAQRVLARGLSLLTHSRITDPTSGFWAWGPEALRLLSDHYPRGYSEPELYLFLSRNHLRINEVSVGMRPRRGGRSSLSAGRMLLALGRTMLAIIIVPFRREAS